MIHAPSFLEIGSARAPDTASFFENVFGWTYTAMGEGGGWLAGPTLKIGVHGQDPHPQIYVYFAVDDLKEAIARVRAAGGEANEPGPAEPGFGRFANCRDPTGVAFGLHLREAG